MRRVVPLAALLLSFSAAAASRPEPEQAKIDFLLDAVKSSSATFIRNGKEYPAAKAVSHLKMKLMFAGSRVQTVRQFVVGVASHSEETKKPYTIRLSGGTTLPLQDWLMGRLIEYETAHGEPPHATPAAGETR